MGEKALRFGVTNSSEKRASTWKCWTPDDVGKSDVYLACRELNGELKASLHESGKWHIAYSQQFYEEHFNALPDASISRFILQWPRPQQIAPGVTLTFRIITPYSSVNISCDASYIKNIIPIAVPPDNCAVETDIIITSPHVLVSHWPGRNSMNTQLVGSIKLSSGETTWVVHRITDIPNLSILRGTPRYFKGKNQNDLTSRNVHVLIFGNEPDGSRTIIESALDAGESCTSP